MQSTSIMATMALALTCQDWRQLGHANDPNVAASTELDITVKRVLALFVVRVVALAAHRNDIKTGSSTYSDLSTTTICQTTLARGVTRGTYWDDIITEELMAELKAYVETIFEQYNHVSYHNFEHAYHVIISANKLLDLMLHQETKNRHHKTYGLKSDPLSHIALLFSALVHDVEHQGVPNRQLVLESDTLALLYNDQSVAEQRSLAIAFAELRKENYTTLRNVLFENVHEYRRFRKAVIDLVLTTDIASPERTQVVKSKWKEAFGDKKEVSERAGMQMVRGEEDDIDDSSSETSNSMTPESYEGLGRIFETPTPMSGALSDDGLATRMGNHDVSSASPRDASMASAPPPAGSNMIHPLPSNDLQPRNRAISGEGRFAGRGSRTIQAAVRRFSMPTSAFDMKKAHIRLGIRRSLDLTGEMIESYNATPARSAKAGSVPTVSEGSGDNIIGDPDEPDELRASVVLEQLLKAADVSPNMQGWDQLEKWSGRLFFELMNSFDDGRGEDPRQGWFRNQITFMESYMLPLARRLNEMQVFREDVGSMFGMIVEENRDRWIDEGMSKTADVTQKWIVWNETSAKPGDDA